MSSQAEFGKGCEFELRAAQKAATAVPSEELACGARALQPLDDATFCSNSGPELLHFVWCR